MCVIMLVNKVRPTEEMIDRAWKQNPDGAGIAWREGDGAKTEVVYEKGIMDIARIKELIARVPLPFVVHFRVASVGGVKETLTHPFAVDLRAPLPLKYRTKGRVLFHNGHWSEWNGKVLDAAIHSNNVLPEGSDWSDSRGMAFMVAIYGNEMMDLLPSQKGVIMSPQKFNIFTGNGWDKINDVWCSNDYFWSGKRYGNTQNHVSRFCSVGRCRNQAMTGKDKCWTCEKDAETKAAATTATGENSSVGQSTTALDIATGGTPRGPLAQMFSMQEVETYYRGKIVSKTTLKKYRKAHGLSLEKGNRKERGLKQMRDLSIEISERLVNGLQG